MRVEKGQSEGGERTNVRVEKGQRRAGEKRGEGGDVFSTRTLVHPVSSAYSWLKAVTSWE